MKLGATCKELQLGRLLRTGGILPRQIRRQVAQRLWHKTMAGHKVRNIPTQQHAEPCARLHPGGNMRFISPNLILLFASGCPTFSPLLTRWLRVPADFAHHADNHRAYHAQQLHQYRIEMQHQLRCKRAERDAYNSTVRREVAGADHSASYIYTSCSLCMFTVSSI